MRDLGLAPSAIGLISPGVDFTEAGIDALSHRSPDAMLTKAMFRRFAAAYGVRRQSHEPTASPLHADLAGLPPVVIDTAERDLLVGQARTLAARCRVAGVNVDYRQHPGKWHDFHAMAGLLPSASRAVVDFAYRLHRMRSENVAERPTQKTSASRDGRDARDAPSARAVVGGLTAS